MTSCEFPTHERPACVPKPISMLTRTNVGIVTDAVLELRKELCVLLHTGLKSRNCTMRSTGFKSKQLCANMHS